MSTKKLSGLFINCIEANDSIHESGDMVFHCLAGSEKYSLDYIEISPENLTVPTRYDFYFFNYHFGTMAWLETELIKESLPGVKFTMVLEVSPNDPFVCCSPDDFDAYCVLDPTLNIHKKNVFSFPRPLEVLDENIVYEPGEIPIIGSFGFATPGKGFEHVIDAVNREFDNALVRINIPYSTYMDESGELAKRVAEVCKNKAKDGIEVIITHDYMTKDQLIRWCGENTLNCFLYDRNQPGLAATTDQAITSGRPLIISKNNTFRHIQKYIKPFPYQTLRDAINGTQKNVEELQQDWSKKRFRERFEEILEEFQFEKNSTEFPETIDLPTKSDDLITRIKKKVAIRTRLGRLVKTVGFELNPKTKPAPKPRSLSSYAQFGEDIVVYNLLKDLSIKNISYLDIGANHPKIFSNTNLFYEQGFSGVLVEPNASLCSELKAERPRDVVLNVGIGIDDNIQEADFHLFSEENDGLSTFSSGNAKYMEEIGMDGIKRPVKEVVKMPLLGINYVISEYFTECPDFISIDVEGWDLQILRTLDFERYNPAVFCVETLAYQPDGSTYKAEEVYDFLNSQGYFPYKETHANTIFLNRNLYEFYLYQKNVKEAASSVEE